MLKFHTVLVRKGRFRIPNLIIPERIRIRESVPLTNGSGSGSCYFRPWPSRLPKKFRKNLFFPKFFCLLLFEDTFTSFFRDKKSKKSQKTVGIKVFLTIFAWWKKDPDPYLLLTDPDPGGPKTYGSYGYVTLTGIVSALPKTFRIRIHSFVWRTMDWTQFFLLQMSYRYPLSITDCKIKFWRAMFLFKQTRTQTTWLPPSWNEGKFLVYILTAFGPAICAIVIVGYLENPLGVPTKKQCCGSRMFIPDPNFSIPDPVPIPDPNFFHPGSRIRNNKFKYFNPKDCF